MSNFANFTVQAADVNMDSYAGIPLIEKTICDLGICSSYSFRSKMPHTSRWIDYAQITEATILLQCLGKTDYADIEKLNDYSLFKIAIGRTISQESYRQKLNTIASHPMIMRMIDDANAQILKQVTLQRIRFFDESLIPLDIDVTPFENPDVDKEGISYTYKGVDGYAPIMAYIGQYSVAFELRPGSQHSEKGAVDFLNRCVGILLKAGIDPHTVLLRVDSGHDAAEFRTAAESLGLRFIIKRNFRSSPRGSIVATAKSVDTGTLSRNNCDMKYRYTTSEPRIAVNEPGTLSVFEVIDPIRDAKTKCDSYAMIRVTDRNNPLFGKDGVPYEVAGWYTNLPVPLGNDQSDPYGVEYARVIIELYKQHATSEQYHSELKTDMNLRLLPSHSFKTNALFLALSAISFNVLRLIGDRALSHDTSLKPRKDRAIQRLRHKTVIELFMLASCEVVKHARKNFIRISRKSAIRKTYTYLMSA